MTPDNTQPDSDMEAAMEDGPSADDLEEIEGEEMQGEDLDEEELDDEGLDDEDLEDETEVVEESLEEEDAEVPVTPLVIKQLEEEDGDVRGDTDSEESAELEDDLVQLLQERLSEEDGKDAEKSDKPSVKLNEEWMCQECFLLVTPSQFGSLSDPKCPSGELNCPLLRRVKKAKT